MEGEEEEKWEGYSLEKGLLTCVPSINFQYFNEYACCRFYFDDCVLLCAC